MSSLKFVDSVSVLNGHKRMTKIQSVTANSLKGRKMCGNFCDGQRMCDNFYA